jgi:hypothetical protein
MRITKKPVGARYGVCLVNFEHIKKGGKMWALRKFVITR